MGETGPVKTEQWLKIKDRNRGVVVNTNNHLIAFHRKIRKFSGMREQDLSPVATRNTQTIQEERPGEWRKREEDSPCPPSLTMTCNGRAQVHLLRQRPGFNFKNQLE